MRGKHLMNIQPIAPPSHQELVRNELKWLAVALKQRGNPINVTLQKVLADKARLQRELPDVALPDDEVRDIVNVAYGLRPLFVPAVISTSREFANKEFDEAEVMLQVKASDSSVLHHPSAGEIHAYRGVGKTNLTIGLLNALATGSEFLCYKATRPFRTIDFDGEMAGSDLQESLSLLAEESSNFHLVARCEQADNLMPSIATSAGLAWYEEAIIRTKAEVAVFDNWSTLANIGTNDEEAFYDFSAWCRKMRLRGVSVIYLHHDGKSGTQRGHSKPEDPLDWVIGLSWPANYRGQEGLKCNLEFEKCRKPVREYAKIAITLEPDGTWCWGKTLDSTAPSIGRPQVEPTEEQETKLKSLLGDGKGERTIAKEMGISRDLARRWKNNLLGKKPPEQLKFDAHHNKENGNAE